ncbi:TRAP transporter small permease [Neobacillus vireti]|uniref:TRAP transporter small permease n=1 Tax=Neobacillus vireti TaxID=220686 RepID=UPI002FFE3144
MNKLIGIFESFDKILSRISAATLFIMMVWIVIDVMFRTLFNSPIQGTIEISGEYLMVILVYLFISDTHRVGGHVSVDSLQKKFSKRMKSIFKIITNIISAIFFFIICIINFQEGLDYLAQNIKSVGVLHYPLAPALFIISLGLLMITLRLIIESIVILFPSSAASSTTETRTENDQLNTFEI